MLKKFFFKRLKKYLLLMVLPFTLILLLFAAYTLQTGIRQKKAELSHTLTRVYENISLVIENTLTQNSLMTENPGLSLAFRRLLLYDEFRYGDYLFLHNGMAFLKGIANSHPYIDDITIYLDGGNVLYNTSSNLCRLDNFYDTQWLEVYRNIPEEEKRYIARRTLESYGQSNEIISVFQRLTYIKGVVLVNIKASAFRQTLNSLTSDDGESVYLVNSDSSLILSQDPLGSDQDFSDLLTDAADLISLSAVSDAENKNEKVLITARMIGGRYQFLGICYDPELDLFLIDTLPFSRAVQPVLTYLISMGMIWLLLFFAALIISYLTTRRNFQQIRYAIELFDQAEKGNVNIPASVKEKDEYDVILNNVLRLFLQTTFLNTQLAQEKYMAEAAELRALQLQINPHFLFNTLQTLNLESARKTGGYTSVNKIIDSLSDILKYSLGNPSSRILLKDEITALKEYVTIQKYRFQDKFIMYYEVDEDVAELPFYRLLLQPLVENSIAHGIQPSEENGYIKLRIYKKDSFLFISVIDSGIGMTKAELLALREHITDRTSENIGLTNVNRRLILHYGEKAALRIQSKKGLGTRVSFCIPVSDDNPDPNQTIFQ